MSGRADAARQFAYCWAASTTWLRRLRVEATLSPAAPPPVAGEIQAMEDYVSGFEGAGPELGDDEGEDDGCSCDMGANAWAPVTRPPCA